MHVCMSVCVCVCVHYYSLLLFCIRTCMISKYVDMHYRSYVSYVFSNYNRSSNDGEVMVMTCCI